ncbi:MAG TPA: type II toxin-antitoxin system death-on-curing family toxin [Gemmataceae bacterium]|nr:type II toxin-antitoxin system death-on-curing family toxin [Gemmataceae bacterium]
MDDVLELHADVVRQSGGSPDLRDRGGLESAVAQPQMAFGGADLYPTLVEKAAALAYSLAMNHPFVDGNKRIAHAAMATMLDANGHKVAAPVDEQEATFLALAAGSLSRNDFTDWLTRHVGPRS